MNFDKPAESSQENYEKIFTEEERSKHLSLDDAHDLANMMRAKIGVNPEKTGEKKMFPKDEVTGYNVTVNKEIYKHDYEKALQDIEELQRLAEEQAKGEEVGSRVKEILKEGGRSLITALNSIGIALGDSPQQLISVEESLKQAREENKFIDAKGKLAKLMRDGEDFGEIESR